MRRILGLAVLAALAATGPLLGATTLVSFTIDDNYPGSVPQGSTGAGVFSDAATTGTNEYFDFRIDPSGTHLNWCVDAEPGPPGNLFVRLNRKLDGDAGTMRCDEHLRPDGNFGVARQVEFRIASPGACGRLAHPQTGLAVTDANGNAWADGGTLPCHLPANDNPRIRFGSLYKSKAKTTNVDFLTVAFGAPYSYEIRSDGTPAILFVGSSKRIVKYAGTYHLVEFPPGERARTVGEAFAMPVSFEFTQH